MTQVQCYFRLTPVPKPRMTRADKWRKRDCVLRYYAFKDECRLRGVSVPPAGARVIFAMPMPKSWSERKKLEMAGKPHTQKPDVDNLLKGLLDAVFDDDSGVHDIRVSKIWDREPGIVIWPPDEYDGSGL